MEMRKNSKTGDTVTIIHESYDIDFAEIDRVSKRLKQTGLFKPNGIFMPHVDFTGLKPFDTTGDLLK